MTGKPFARQEVGTSAFCTMQSLNFSCSPLVQKCSCGETLRGLSTFPENCPPIHRKSKNIPCFSDTLSTNFRKLWKTGLSNCDSASCYGDLNPCKDDLNPCSNDLHPCKSAKIPPLIFPILSNFIPTIVPDFPTFSQNRPIFYRT